MNIKLNIKSILSSIEQDVQLVAVSKTKPVELLQQAYDIGQRVFGENKVQELTEKSALLPKDISWHMIGHLQTNKVKFIAPFISLVHAVDSKKLLDEINKRAKQNNRTIHCLLQIHIAQESNKFGLTEKQAIELLELDYSNVSIDGLMGMATFTSDKNQIRKEFKYLKSVFESLKTKHSNLKIISMGMSNDYPIAIEEGSNMVRIGSSIFGNR